MLKGGCWRWIWTVGVLGIGAIAALRPAAADDGAVPPVVARVAGSLAAVAIEADTAWVAFGQQLQAVRLTDASGVGTPGPALRLPAGVTETQRRRTGSRTTLAGNDSAQSAASVVGASTVTTLTRSVLSGSSVSSSRFTA